MSRLACSARGSRARSAGNGLGVQQAGPADHDERRRQDRDHVLRPGRRPACGRLAGRDALPRARREQDRPGNPARDVAQLASPRRSSRRRAMQRSPSTPAATGSRRGSSRSTGRARSRTCASSSAGSPRSRASTARRIGAFGYSYGGGAIWRATAEGVPFAAIEPAITWTDLYSALLPQDLARSGVLLGFWQSIQARAAPGLESIVNDAIAGQNLGAVHAFADQRSVRTLLGSIRVPTFLMQGRRDFAFDLDHALTAYSRLKAPKRLYLADFGHPPAANPPGEAAHVAARGARVVRPLPEGPSERDRQAAADRGRPGSVDRPDVPLPGAAHDGRRCGSRSRDARRSDRPARWREHGPASARAPRPSALRSCASRSRARTAGRRSLPSSLR